jgi:IMP dehydrogenase
MDTVIDMNNIYEFLHRGIIVCLPRTIKYHEYITFISECKYERLKNNVFLSVGFKDIDEILYYDKNFKINSFKKIPNILIDVANGHMHKVLRYAQKIKKAHPDINIMVGNIANPQTYIWYMKTNIISYIRCGIGNGGGCLTTKNTGVGYPNASLIYDIQKAKFKYFKENKNTGLTPPKIIADGGMKEYVDIIKALGLGADYVMIGSLFNKALESAGDNYIWGIKIKQKIAEKLFKWGFPVKKYFRGMSTKQAQKAMGNTHIKTSEGVIRYRPIEYKLDGWLENFNHYLRTAMSYNGSKSIHNFIGRMDFVNITQNAYRRFNK